MYFSMTATTEKRVKTPKNDNDKSNDESNDENKRTKL